MCWKNNWSTYHFCFAESFDTLMSTNDNSGVECFSKICLPFLPYSGEMKFSSRPPIFRAFLPAFASYVCGLHLWCVLMYFKKRANVIWMFGSKRLKIQNWVVFCCFFFWSGLALSCAKTEWRLGRKELSITRDAGWCWSSGWAAPDTALVLFLFEHLSEEFWYFAILFTPVFLIFTAYIMPCCFGTAWRGYTWLGAVFFHIWFSVNFSIREIIWG